MGNPYAGLDEAGAGNVAMGAGLRPTTKGVAVVVKQKTLVNAPWRVMSEIHSVHFSPLSGNDLFSVKSWGDVLRFFQIPGA
jgi:hypothetical protein